MKKNLLVIMCLSLLLISSYAVADNYETGDQWEKEYTGTGGIAVAEVISKSVTLRNKPSMSAGKITSIPSESCLMVLEEVNDTWLKVEWQKNGNKTYTGYIRSEYVVINPEYITLRRSNTPAYSVPSRSGKLLGSLSKMTRLRVIGVWGDYFVVFLRSGAAFIPKDADVWTETELNRLKESTYLSILGGYRGQTMSSVSMRTGPGSDWPEVVKLKSGTKLDVSSNQENGWVFAKDMNGNAGYVSIEEIR